MSDTCNHPDSSFDRTLCAEPCGAMHNYCTECGECVDPCPHKATPSSGVTEGKAESGDEIDYDGPCRYCGASETECCRLDCYGPCCRPSMEESMTATPAPGETEGQAESGELDPALVERCAGAAYELELLAGGTPWESVIRRNWAYQQDIYDRWTGIARTVLATAAPPPAPEPPDAATVLAGLRESMRAIAAEWDLMLTSTAPGSAMRHAIALVEAAQQRLADQGQGGGSDGFKPRRDDAVAVWLKSWRNQYPPHSSHYQVMDLLLYDYVLHADTGTPLDRHACEPGCDCTPGARDEENTR